MYIVSKVLISFIFFKIVEGKNFFLIEVFIGMFFKYCILLKFFLFKLEGIFKFIFSMGWFEKFFIDVIVRFFLDWVKSLLNLVVVFCFCIKGRIIFVIICGFVSREINFIILSNIDIFISFFLWKFVVWFFLLLR